MRVVRAMWVCAALMLAASWAAAQGLRLAYPDQEVPPFLMGNGPEVPDAPGITIEQVRRAARQAGREPSFVRLPVPRINAYLQSGRLDAVACLSYTQERAAFLAYPLRDGKPDARRRCATLRYVLYQRRGGSVAWDGSTLQANGPVGIWRATSIAERLRAMGAEVVEVGSDEQLFGLLERGRIAAIATLEIMADHHLSQTGSASRFEKLEPSLSTYDYFLAVSKPFYAANKAFVEQMWQHVGELREPIYRELAPKYLH